MPSVGNNCETGFSRSLPVRTKVSLVFWEGRVKLRTNVLKNVHTFDLTMLLQGPYPVEIIMGTLKGIYFREVDPGNTRIVIEQ